MIGIRLEPELKELFHEIAEDERRSLSNFIVNAALTYLKDHEGTDWREENEKKPKK